MNQATDNGSRRTIGRVLGHAAAALLFTAAIIQPKVANAAHDVGGFHGGGGGFHGGGFHHPLGISAAGSDSEGSMRRFGGATAIPITIMGITVTIPIIGLTATIPAPAITVTIPIMATARSPTPGRPGTTAPTPQAIIPM